MAQGNVGYALAASTNYTPGATAGPAAGYAPISLILVTQGGAATLDYYDLGGKPINDYSRNCQQSNCASTYSNEDRSITDSR